MRLGLLPAQDELRRAAERALAGAVDAEALAIRQAPEGDPASGLPGLVEEARRSEEPLIAAALVAEAAGLAFAPVSPRPALLASWIAARPRPELGAVDPLRTVLGLPGDGTADDIPSATPGSQGGAAGDWSLEGEFVLLEDAPGAASLLTVARTPDGAGLFLVPLAQPGAERPARDRLDPTRPAFGLALSGASARRLADAPATAALLPEIESLGRLLAAAESLGISALLLRLVTDYAKRRTQFGTVIGSFQAVSHACADIACEVELLRSLVYATAASPLASGAPDRAMAARAKALAAETGPKVANRALQLFGGEGLTWGRGLHFALRRQQALRLAFGTSERCYDEVSEVLA
jgi:hypothetical protein